MSEIKKCGRCLQFHKDCKLNGILKIYECKDCQKPSKTNIDHDSYMKGLSDGIQAERDGVTYKPSSKQDSSLTKQESKK